MKITDFSTAELEWQTIVEQAKPIKRLDGTLVPNLELRMANAVNAFITQDEQLQLLIRRVRNLAKFDVNVMITGQSGTGKHLIAEILHGTRLGAFIELNASGFHENLFESELFGHEAHAYTGAGSKPRKGKLLEAEGGTLFLDEVGDLPISQQVKLLKAIEEKAFYPLGSDKLQRYNCRFVFATNKDLAAGIVAGWYRNDLYHRINVIPIHIPSLKSRPMDAVLIARHMIASISEAASPLTEEEEQLLLEVTSNGLLENGNVRQLNNWITRRFYMTGDLQQAIEMAYHAPLLQLR